MASRCPTDQPYEGMRHISLCLSYDTVEQATRSYDILRQDGELRMALTPTFWAGAFAMLIDIYTTLAADAVNSFHTVLVKKIAALAAASPTPRKQGPRRSQE